MFKKFHPLVLILVIGVLIISGVFVYLKNSKPASNGVVNPEDHIKGDPAAPITILVFSDFQCPFCGNYHKTLQQALDNYPGKVRLLFKHFPLTGHLQARPAAEASECAAEQGKFWEFADGLFSNQEKLGGSLYQELASNLGLNLSQFNECISSRKYKDKVEANYQEGLAKKFKGTPASFINGQEVSGAVPYEKIKSIIDSLL